MANFGSRGWISIEKIGLSWLCTNAGLSSFMSHCFELRSVGTAIINATFSCFARQFFVPNNNELKRSCKCRLGNRACDRFKLCSNAVATPESYERGIRRRTGVSFAEKFSQSMFSVLIESIKRLLSSSISCWIRFDYLVEEINRADKIKSTIRIVPEHSK